MEHALDLARKGIGLASPNPTVGCVIVKDGAILAEGFHQYDWQDHAEILALPPGILECSAQQQENNEQAE